MYRGKVNVSGDGVGWPGFPRSRGKCPKDKGCAVAVDLLGSAGWIRTILRRHRPTSGQADGCPAAGPRAPFAYGISPASGGNPSTTPPLLTRVDSRVDRIQHYVDIHQNVVVPESYDTITCFSQFSEPSIRRWLCFRPCCETVRFRLPAGVGGQAKSTINGGMGCWRRNRNLLIRRWRRCVQRARSASVWFWRIFRARPRWV